MKKLSFQPAGALLLLCMTFNQGFAQKITTISREPFTSLQLHSDFVKDTYSIFIKKPKGYDKEPDRKYTTIYLLDANVYFDMVAAMVDTYNEMGIMAPVILVGIGYKNFEQMEALRTRDYLFPKALPVYEMKKSGGADKFQQFIQQELIPYIDKTHRTKADNRVLMGHSFGGYFCLYALLQNMAQQDDTFRSYIAASPSLQYNDQYLFTLLNQRTEGFTIPKFVYTSIGGAEDEENGEHKENINAIYTKFNKAIQEKNFRNITYKGEVYSNFKHLETATATFSKGIFFLWIDNR